MVVILIRRCTTPEKEESFLADYRSGRPSNHPDFVDEFLTKVGDSGELPEAMRSLPIGVEGTITYINLAIWRSAKSFQEQFNPTTWHDETIEVADRQRIVLDIQEPNSLTNISRWLKAFV